VGSCFSPSWLINIPAYFQGCESDKFQTLLVKWKGLIMHSIYNLVKINFFSPCNLFI
jgi:hypothetical protein